MEILKDALLAYADKIVYKDAKTMERSEAVYRLLLVFYELEKLNTGLEINKLYTMALEELELTYAVAGR